MRRYIKYTFLVFMFLGITAFQKKEKVDYVARELKLRIENYRKEQLERCRKNIVEDAEVYVDSIIALQMNEAFVDTIKSPPKPPRPDRPYDTLKLDSTDLSPLIKSAPDTSKIKE